MQVSSEQRLDWPRSGGLVVAAAGLVISAGVALAAAQLADATPVDPPLGALAFGTVVAAPGLLALMGLAARPGLLMAAAAALVPFSLLSFSGVGLLLLVPVMLLILAYGARSPGLSAPPTRDLATAGLVVGLLIAAVMTLLFVHQDPRSYTTSADGRTTVRSGPEPSSFVWASSSSSSSSGSASASSMELGESGGGTSDVITNLESVMALGLVAVAIAASWRLSKPQQMPNT